MTTVAYSTSATCTPADGCSMYRSSPDPTFVGVVTATTLLAPATASTYEALRLIRHTTTAGPAGEIEHVSTETTATAIMEIRRRSGLTWEELGDLFDVSRRSVHHWANGKPVSARHDQTIQRMLAAIRYLDQGGQVGTRSLLLAVDQAMGTSAFDLLKSGSFKEAMGRVKGVRARRFQRTALSDAAQNARRPQELTLLLEAKQNRPDIPAKARIAHPKQTPRTTS